MGCAKMNRKLLATLVMGALILTNGVTTTYAAGLQLPGDGKLGKLGDEVTDVDGDKVKAVKQELKKEKDVSVKIATKTEVKNDATSSTKIKHEGKLYIDGKIDDMWTAEVGLNIETKSDTAKQSETEKWEMENVWLEYQKSPEFSFKFGRQTYHVAKGLYMDQDGVFGGKAIYKLDKNNTAEVFLGRDDQDREGAGIKLKNGKVTATPASNTTLVEVLNFAHKIKHGSIGAYIAKQDRQDQYGGGTDRFLGLYGNYRVLPDTDFNFEYLKNNETDTNGYVAELKFGKLKKVGDYTFAVDYMDVGKELMNTNSYTDYDSQISDPALGFKGPGITVVNKLSKHSQVQLQRWWGRDKADQTSIPVTKLILYVKF